MKSIILICLTACFVASYASILPVIQPRDALAAEAPDAEVCYDHYGCFSTVSPWTSLLRPISALPKPPYEVGTRFLLYTRTNPTDNFELMPDNEIILKFSPYSAERQTVVIIHGFTDSDKSDWVIKARNAYLSKEDVNVLVVDWAPGAKGNYHRATANSRLVGAQVSRMLSFLQAKASLNFDNLRIVGHSLGAHVAGYAGSRLNGEIGIIIALDAAEPYFGGTDPIVRLDITDAKFIQAIHTNGDSFGLGIINSFAHVDLYPNGGHKQPGCKDLISSWFSSIVDFIFWDFDGAIGTLACSHVRVVDFLVESIQTTCPFVAHKCGSYNDFKNGKCTTACSAEGSCTVLGYGSETNTAIRGDFYLNTDDKDSYCLQNVRVDSPVAQSQAKTVGKVTATFRNANGELSEKFTIADGTITNGQLLNTWLEVPSRVLVNPSERAQLILRYTRGGLLPTTQPKYLSLDTINLYILDEDLKLQLVNYSGVTLEAGTDLIVN